MGFLTTKFRRFLLSPCDYDLFAKVKEPLRGTQWNIRHELIRAIGRSIQNINKDGRANGVRCFPNIWQKVINKGATVFKVRVGYINVSPLWTKAMYVKKYRTVAITVHSTPVYQNILLIYLPGCRKFKGNWVKTSPGTYYMTLYVKNVLQHISEANFFK